MPLVSREDDDGVRWKDDGAGRLKAVEGRSHNLDGASIPHHGRVDPAVIDIAVKDFDPAAGRGEAHPIIVLRRVVHARDDEHIAAAALEPPMKRQNTIVVVHVNNPNARATQGRLPPAQSNHVLGKVQLVHHGLLS